jgi:hypothetical protein
MTFQGLQQFSDSAIPYSDHHVLRSRGYFTAVVTPRGCVSDICVTQQFHLQWIELSVGNKCENIRLGPRKILLFFRKDFIRSFRPEKNFFPHFRLIRFFSCSGSSHPRGTGSNGSRFPSHPLKIII